MLARSLRILVIYVAGVLILGGWAALQLAHGVPREGLALVIVLALAWTFGWLPVITPLLLVVRMRAIQKLMKQVQLRIRPGAPPSEEQVTELEAYFTALAASENGIPEFVARRIVRRAIALILQQQPARATADA
jgi:type VI protein secretion system component VasK